MPHSLLQVHWYAEPYFRAHVAAEFAPEPWLSALRPSPRGSTRRWFRAYSQLHLRVHVRLPLLERAYSELSQAVHRGSPTHVDTHEILQKWRVMQSEKNRREEEVRSARAQFIQLESNLEHWALRKDEQFQIMKRKHTEMRRDAQVLKILHFVLKRMDFVLKMMDCLLHMMYFVLKVMYFVGAHYPKRGQLPREARLGDGLPAARRTPPPVSE